MLKSFLAVLTAICISVVCCGYLPAQQITKASSSAGGGGSVFTGSTAVTSTFSATPTFSLADTGGTKSPVRFEPGVMTANVTAVTFSNKTAGAKFSLVWVQDATGSRTVAYGASASSTCPISPDANATTVQLFEVAADGSTVNGIACFVAGGNGLSQTQGVPITPPAGYIRPTFGSSANKNNCTINENGTTLCMAAALPAVSHQFLTSYALTGVFTQAAIVAGDLPAAITTGTNCSSSASPAVCGSASAGSVTFPTGVTSVTLVVNTTAVTANSQILLFSDDTLGTKLSVTCNSTLATLVGGMAITARTAGTSFTVTYNGTIATNPLCASFLVVN